MNSQKWQRPELCRFCQQGSALSLYRCPGCSRVSIICEEAGCVFADPVDIANGIPSQYFARDAKCPHCQEVPIRQLVAASLEQIEAAGIARDNLVQCE